MIGLEHYDVVQKLCEERCRSVLKEVDSKEFEIMIVEAYEKKIMSKKRLYDGLSDKERLEEKLKYLKFLIKEYNKTVDKSILNEAPAMMTADDDKKVLEDEDATFIDKYLTSAIAGLNDLPSILSAIDYIPGVRDIADIINSSIAGMPDSTEKQEIIADIAISKLELNVFALTSAAGLVSAGAAETASWILEIIVHALIFCYYALRFYNNFYKAFATDKGAAQRYNYVFRAAMDYVDAVLQLASLVEIFPVVGNALSLAIIKPAKIAQDFIRKLGWKGISVLLGASTIIGFAIGETGALEGFGGMLGLIMQTRGAGLPLRGLQDSSFRIDVLQNLDENLDSIVNYKGIENLKLDPNPEIKALGINMIQLYETLVALCDELLKPNIREQVTKYLGMIGRQNDADNFFDAVIRFKSEAIQYTIDFFKFSKMKGVDISNETDLYKIIASHDPELAFFLKFFGKIDADEQAATLAMGMAVVIKTEAITKAGKTGDKNVLKSVGNKQSLLPDEIFKDIAEDVMENGPGIVRKSAKLREDLSDLNDHYSETINALDNLNANPDAGIVKISKEAAETMHEAYFSKVNDAYSKLCKKILNRNPSASLTDASNFKDRGKIGSFLYYVNDLKNRGIITDQEYTAFIKEFDSLFQKHIGKMIEKSLKKFPEWEDCTKLLAGFEKMLQVFSKNHADDISNQFPRTWRYFNTSKEGVSRKPDIFEFDFDDYQSNSSILYRMLSPSVILEIGQGIHKGAIKIVKQYDDWVGNNYDNYGIPIFTGWRTMISLRLSLLKLAYLRLSTRIGLGSVLRAGNLCNPEAQKYLRSIGDQDEYRAGLAIAQLANLICTLGLAPKTMEDVKKDVEKEFENAGEKGVEIGSELKEIYEELIPESGEPTPGWGRGQKNQPSTQSKENKGKAPPSKKNKSDTTSTEEEKGEASPGWGG